MHIKISTTYSLRHSINARNKIVQASPSWLRNDCTGKVRPGFLTRYEKVLCAHYLETAQKKWFKQVYHLQSHHAHKDLVSKPAAYIFQHLLLTQICSSSLPPSSFSTIISLRRNLFQLLTCNSSPMVSILSLILFGKGFSFWHDL